MPTTRPRDMNLAPLSEPERLRVDRALRRLHESIREFWAAWPVERRSASQLSRELGVDRTTCQRLSAVARQQFDGRSMLESMPGPKALRRLIDACGEVADPPSPDVQARFRAAVDGFDELLRESAGSLSQLRRRFAATGNDAQGTEDDLEPQEALFHAARRVTGRHVHTVSSIGLYDTTGVTEHELRHVRISSNHGIVARPDAVPMVLEAFDAVTNNQTDHWQRTPVLLETFTSAEWTTVALQPSSGFASRAMEITRSEQPSDVCMYTAFPVPHPRTLDNPIEESWYVLYSPAAMLVFDMYLHKSIARQCLVSADAHLWQTSFANAPHGKWHTRLPTSPTITQLGRGIEHADSAHHPAQAALTAELFKRANADPSEYIGFRCEQAYPVWRSGYRFELDFGDDG